MSNGTTANPSLLKDKVGIGLGSLGLWGPQAFFIAFIMYHLTDNMLLGGSVIGVILLVSRILDAFTDLFMGTIVDRTKTKWGKARPWLIWMAVPALVFMILLFWVPPLKEGGNGRIVYTIIVYNLFSIFNLTAMALPMQSLVSLITADSKQRMTISQIFGVCQTGGSAVFLFWATDIMGVFGGGKHGFFLYFAICSIIGVALMVACFFLTKERARGEEHMDASKAKEVVPLSQALPAVFKNRYWWHFMIIYLVVSILPTFLMAGAIYYCKYNIGGGADGAKINSLLWFGITIGVFLFIPLTRKVGKANSAAAGIIVQALGSVVLFIWSDSVAAVWVSSVMRSVGVGGWLGNLTAMLADVVEYGEWKTGTRTEGTIYAGATFGYKFGGGISGSVIGFLIGWGGYDPTLAVQTEKALLSFKWIFIGGPFIGSCLIVIALFLFKLEKHIPKIKADLEARHEGKA